MLSYKDSGVDIDEGNALVEGLKPLVQSTFDDNVIGGIGSFAGAYAMPSGYKQPVILGATDGVGTKLRLAIDSGILESVGVDLVAMCVNDLICNFATPIFFLDYYATGALEKHNALRVIQGIVEGCKLARCALIGGESAEMPGMYASGDFDLAGFAVGIAERADLQRSQSVQAGDVLIALPSSGLHSNGYSLVRKVLERAHLTLDSVFEGVPLAQTLLVPTTIYVQTFLELKAHIKSLAHITGGGIIENLPRALPKGLGACIQKNALKTPPIFALLRQYVSEEECFRTFNMGVGMIFVVDAKNADFVIEKSGGYVLGRVDSQSNVVLQ